jgi:hypothetical protein
MHRLLLNRLATALVASGVLWVGSGPASAQAPFQRTLSLQDVTFAVKSTGQGSQQELAITTKAGKRAIKPIRQTVDGTVVGAEVADLNGNGTPEVFVYVQSAGSGSYGELVAYAVDKGNQLSPIALQELSGALAKGYMGHDEFQVVEGCLTRRFPIYKPGDSNAKPTGGLRQICYKLKNGEATWILRPTSVLKFDR